MIILSQYRFPRYRNLVFKPFLWMTDLKSRGIRVNVIHPGPIDTPLFQSMTEEQKAGYIGQVPLGRAGRSSEIATTALFLASDDSSFITGTSLNVDGGAAQV